ncbi:DUF551 domain-containing protein [Citrobacter koseri]|uniref:DUF551 domain-containing protein n=1 Tax=Citrobacter koseri TaxID=545 RepID=UPI002006B005|nr:DUF551 domain-containing protein [Citrobacter koseri]
MKTIQLSERELSMIFSMLTPPYCAEDIRSDEFNELRNKVFYALRDAQNDEPVSNRDELPVSWIKCSERMPTKQDGTCFLTWNGQYIGKELFLMGAFQCLKPEIITHWMPLPAAPQEGMRNCIEEKKVAFREEMEMGSRLTKQRFRVK